jgi:CXXX repeat modification system protein
MANKDKEFLPIKLDDEKLIEEVKNIRTKKVGLRKVLNDLTEEQGKLEKKNNDWWNKILAKYNLSDKKFVLEYDYDTKTISKKY